MKSSALWTSAAARAAYADMCKTKQYGAVRAGPILDAAAARELREHLFGLDVVLMGAGPDLATDLVVARTVGARRLALHDFTESGARELVAASPLLAEPAWGDVTDGQVHLPFEPELTAFAGYWLANLAEGDRRRAVAGAPGRWLLADFPLAHADDPRRHERGWGGEATEAEEKWWSLGAVAALGPGATWYVDVSYGDGDDRDDSADYEAVVYAASCDQGPEERPDDVELLRFARRSPARWLREVEEAGWVPRAVSLAQGPPRMAVLAERRR